MTEQEEMNKAAALIERIKKGNQTLNDAWYVIKELDGEEKNRELERWHQANEKLSGLCTELTMTGHTQCLYIDSEGKKNKLCLEPGDQLGCRVCPSLYPHWSDELMALSSPNSRKESK